jgi:hypothetical protein
MGTKYQIAAVHAAPIYMDKEATTEKIIHLIEKAAQDSIDFLAFSEAFLPGYPVGAHIFTLHSYVRLRLMTNRITAGSILSIYSRQSNSSRLSPPIGTKALQRMDQKSIALEQPARTIKWLLVLASQSVFRVVLLFSILRYLLTAEGQY